MYWWEPADSFYPGNVLAECAFGQFYTMLVVEQSNEGWHGLLLKDITFDAERGDTSLELVDEMVFDAKYAAVQWCESMDTTRAPMDEDYSDEAYWDEMLNSYDESGI